MKKSPHKREKPLGSFGMHSKVRWEACLLTLAVVFVLIFPKGSLPLEIKPDEVPITPLAAPLYQKKPLQFRECKSSATFVATSSDLAPFVPDELQLMEPAAPAGTKLMVAFGGSCPRSTLGHCAFTLLLAVVKLNIPGHPNDGQIVGLYPIHAFVSNPNYYKVCELTGGCPLKLGNVKVKGRRRAKTTLKFDDIRPINASGEFDVEAQPPKMAAKLVKMVVKGQAPLDDAALELFEQATGLPFRNSEGELEFIFPPLVNFKAIPRVDGSGLDVAQLTQVPFQKQTVRNPMWGPGTLSLASTMAMPIGEQIKVDVVFGGVNFDFDFEFGWPAGVVLYDYLAP